jgi:MFS family permease
MTTDVLTTPAPPPILTRPMALLMVTAFGALIGFYLLLSVVPLYLADSGGGAAGAGLATGAMMLTTVLVELAAPQLLALLGYRSALGFGLLLLSLPTLALLASPDILLVLGVCLVRGAGFGIVVVAGSALAAELAPAGRRGEALGWYGVVVGVPGVVGLPAGVWLTEHAGYAPVFVAATAAVLLPLGTVLALPAKAAHAPASGSVLGAWRVGGLARPAVIFTAITFAAGMFATFLPLAVPSGSRGLAAVALLVQSLTMLPARFAAGRFADRHGSGPLLVPSVLVAVLGAALTSFVDSPLAIVLGMAVFGVGFGAAQNVTVTLMMARVGKAEYGQTSALWNLAYDAGFGIGALGLGLVVGPFGYVTGFVLTAAVLLATVVPARRDRHAFPPAER